MDEPVKTLVTNVADDRCVSFDAPPERAVIAAYEQYEKGNFDEFGYPGPEEHPAFRAFAKGFACGDWIARKAGPSADPGPTSTYR